MENKQENNEEQAYVNPADPPSEEQMQQQEKEDDADLNELKEKLRNLQSAEPPSDMNELIQHLKMRVEYAEQAIITAEEVISHERQNRKAVSRELRERTDELRILVNTEKKKLQDKVHLELELTLQQALREKIYAEEELQKLKDVMEERNMLVEELDGIIFQLKDNFTSTEQTNQMQLKVIASLEEALQNETEQKQHYKQESEERQSQIDKLREDLMEAHGVVTKLEEARIILNRLLGQNGVITEYERSKYLSHLPLPAPEDNMSQGGSLDNSQALKPPKAPTISNTNNKMLTQNNQYFYEGGVKGAAQQLYNQYGSGQAALLDEANEDDFWYQAPKGSAGVGASGEYQGYVDNLNNQGNSRVGSRRGLKK